jgi:hypothetical protein
MKLAIVWQLTTKKLAQRLCHTMYQSTTNNALGEPGNYSSTTVVKVGIKDSVIPSTIT